MDIWANEKSGRGIEPERVGFDFGVRRGLLPDVDLRVIETFGFDGARFVRLPQHMARMAVTCAGLGYPFDPLAVLVHLDALPDMGPLRVRVTVGSLGDVVVSHAPLVPVAGPWRVGLAVERLASGDPWLRVKTTERRLYDRVRAGLAAGMDEVVFANQRDEVCEGTISSVFFDAGAGLCTPPLACGLLPGVLRAEMLAAGRCREAVLMVADLGRVRLWLGNSLRGLISANMMGSGFE